MTLDSTVESVTADIEARSRDTRARYLAQIAAAVRTRSFSRT